MSEIDKMIEKHEEAEQSEYQYKTKRLLEVYRDYIEECQNIDKLIDELEKLLSIIDYNDLTDNIVFHETEHYNYIAVWHRNRLCAIKLEKDDPIDKINLADMYEREFIYMQHMTTDVLHDFIMYLPYFLLYLTADIMQQADKLRITKKKLEYMLNIGDKA